MTRKKTKKGQKNFVILFFASHLLILLVMLLACIVGFQAAFDIVRNDILDSTEFSLRQCIDYMDESLIDLRTLGVQTARSNSLQQLGRMPQSDPDYYFVAKAAIEEYYERMQYYSPVWAENTCVYISGTDRILYRDSLYRPEVFDQYLQLWNTTPEEWEALCTSKRVHPFLTATEQGTVYYVIPCTSVLGTGPKIGSAFFRVDASVILDHLSLVKKYRSYCLAIYNSEGDLIFKEDQMAGQAQLPERWDHRHGVWQDGSNLVLSVSGVSDIGLHYILVLPEQQAMQRLSELRTRTLLMIFLCGVLGIAVSVYAALHNGVPVNSIARALKENRSGDEENVGADLNHISHAVAKLLEDNEQLLLEQQQSLPARQKSFFHDLLKSDFVSGAEIQYAAECAQIDLTGNLYCAAELRLFPSIDVDAIDGQTVEDARVLQKAIRAHLEEVCRRPVWSYKRNTLEMLYIFEIRDQQALLEVLRSTVLWLRNGYQVDCRWGVGSPCHDLTLFWRSAEEATAALYCDSPDDPVCEYSSNLAADEAYYFPYSVEERLSRALAAGDERAVEDTLELVQRENFVRRSLSRVQFRRLHGRIAEILAAQLQQTLGVTLQVSRLEKLVLAYDGNCEAYFEQLNDICHVICETVVRQKLARRSGIAQQVEQYLNENYADPSLGLAKISVAFDLSEGYLSALFKKEVGVNFAEYLEQLRIHAACQMLTDGEKVTDVSAKVGYNSIQSFRRAFKRVMGTSPSEYRGG